LLLPERTGIFLRKKLWNTVHERVSVAIMNLMQKKADQKPAPTAEKTEQKPTLTAEKRSRNRTDGRRSHPDQQPAAGRRWRQLLCVQL
jgi:hypothetical protein